MTVLAENAHPSEVLPLRMDNPFEFIRADQLIPERTAFSASTGVFLSLSRLRPPDRITVITEAGQSLVYEVVSVDRVKWQRKTFQELARHLEYLAPTGQERLTLMSCGGANVLPFPERVYVVARPVR